MTRDAYEIGKRSKAAKGSRGMSMLPGSGSTKRQTNTTGPATGAAPGLMSATIAKASSASAPATKASVASIASIATTASKASKTSTTPRKRRRLNGRLDGPDDLVRPLAPVAPRPVWLLPTPLKLATRNGLPYYRSSLQIVSGPECIEAGWWDGQGATRDYFIVGAEDAALYWVYRERAPVGEQQAAWFLHGVFG